MTEQVKPLMCRLRAPVEAGLWLNEHSRNHAMQIMMEEWHHQVQSHCYIPLGPPNLVVRSGWSGLNYILEMEGPTFFLGTPDSL